MNFALYLFVWCFDPNEFKVQGEITIYVYSVGFEPTTIMLLAIHSTYWASGDGRILVVFFAIFSVQCKIVTSSSDLNRVLTGGLMVKDVHS